MLRFAVGLERAPQVYHKTPKMRFFGVSDFFSEKFRNSVWIVLWPHWFTFCVQLSRKSSAGKCRKWAKRCVAGVTKIRKMRFFGAISRPFGGGRQTFAGEPATWPHVSLWNFVRIGSYLPELVPKKSFRHIRTATAIMILVPLSMRALTTSARGKRLVVT